MTSLEPAGTAGRRILHVLSQRPSLTGSGITLDALVRLAGETGWEQQVVAGVPAGAPVAGVGGLAPEAVHTVTFAGTDPGLPSDLPFPVPGMSDVMPYRSSVWSRLTTTEVDAYCHAWQERLARVVEEFRPDVIHAHHAWLVSSLVRDVAPGVPLAIHTHGTGLRQMVLCPGLAGRARQGCSRADRLLVLHGEHARAYGEALGMEPSRLTVVGAGYREELFNTGGADQRQPLALLYAGKLSRAKGLPSLLDAAQSLAAALPGLVLHVAGGGDGEEADQLRQRIEEMAPLVTFHGRLDQQQLAALMRRSSIFVLPSFYEGLPLVLVEALASGCRLVATALPGVVEELAPRMGRHLDLVPLPRLVKADQPVAEDLPAFTANLAESIRRSLAGAGETGSADPDLLESFTWRAVFRRVEQAWAEISG